MILKNKYGSMQFFRRNILTHNKYFQFQSKISGQHLAFLIRYA